MQEASDRRGMDGWLDWMCGRRQKKEEEEKGAERADICAGRKHLSTSHHGRDAALAVPDRRGCAGQGASRGGSELRHLPTSALRPYTTLVC
jgi:hypothetical protein